MGDDLRCLQPVVPTFKKGSKSLPINNKLISLTSIVGRYHIEGFLLQNILSNVQQSCQTNLLSFLFMREKDKTQAMSGCGYSILGLCKSVRHMAIV